jgi:hypothetical protein
VLSVLCALILLAGGLLGLLLAYGGAAWLLDVLAFARSAVGPFPGTVIRYDVREDDEGRYCYPIVEFQVAGERHEYRGKSGVDGRPSLKLGDRVSIYYRGSSSTDTRLGKWQGMPRALCLFLGGTGLVLSTAWGLVALIRSW